MDQFALHPQGRVDIGQNMFSGFFLQVDIAAAGNGDKALFDFFGKASVISVHQGHKFLFKVVLLVGLADEIQNRKAFFAFTETQPAPQLLEENGQRFRGPQEQDGVDFFDVHTFVVQIHYEYKFHLPGNQLLLCPCPFRIGSITGEIHGGHPMVIEKFRHILGMGFGHTEPQTNHVVPIGHVPIGFRQNPIRSFLGTILLHGIYVGQFASIVAAPGPANLAQVGGIIHPKVLERTKQFPVDGVGQTNFYRNTAVKV